MRRREKTHIFGRKTARAPTVKPTKRPLRPRHTCRNTEPKVHAYTRYKMSRFFRWIDFLLTRDHFETSRRNGKVAIRAENSRVIARMRVQM